MSQKERDRLKAVHEVQKGHLAQGVAGLQLGLTDRWVQKLLVRLRADGLGARGLPGFWHDAGRQVLGRAGRHASHPGDATAMAAGNGRAHRLPGLQERGWNPISNHDRRQSLTKFLEEARSVFRTYQDGC